MTSYQAGGHHPGEGCFPKPLEVMTETAPTAPALPPLPPAPLASLVVVNSITLGCTLMIITCIVTCIIWRRQREHRLALRRRREPSLAIELQRDQQAALETAVRALPVRKFRIIDGGEAAEECAVCLCPFGEGDELRDLPCRHSFHKECIDRWLLGSPAFTRRTAELPSCPLCKSIPLQLPTVTPTAETPWLAPAASEWVAASASATEVDEDEAAMQLEDVVMTMTSGESVPRRVPAADGHEAVPSEAAPSAGGGDELASL